MAGSLQIKGNYYYIVYPYKDINNKTKYKWVSTKIPVKGGKKAAEAALQKWKIEHENCEMAFVHLQFSDYMEMWFKEACIDLQPSTIRGYKSNLKNHILPYFKANPIKLTDLKIRHLDKFYSTLSREKELSPQSVRHCHRIISKALNEAIRKELISSNPASYAKLPKVQKYVGSFLNVSQIQEAAGLFKGHITQHVIKFICTYGVRRSEALGLCWDKVDFENNQFTICRAFIQGEGKNYLKEYTKNDSSYRTLPLTADMRKMLLFLKTQRDVDRETFGASYIENNMVFVWPTGEPISPNYLTKTFHQIMNKSDLPTIRLHDLRHSSATNLLSRGTTLVEIQQFLGHSQPSTTLNFYSHADASSKKQIQALLEKEFNFSEHND